MKLSEDLQTFHDELVGVTDLGWDPKELSRCIYAARELEARLQAAEEAAQLWKEEADGMIHLAHAYLAELNLMRERATAAEEKLAKVRGALDAFSRSISESHDAAALAASIGEALNG